MPPARGHGKSVQRELAARPYAELVAMVRHAPWWSPVSNRLTEGLTNTVEFFVHHEDVRRAQDRWLPRELPKPDQEALWKRAATLARLRLRRFPGALLVQAPGLRRGVHGRGRRRRTPDRRTR